MMGEFAGMGWWAPGFGMIFMILWWGLVIFGIVALVRWLLTGSGNTEVSSDAMDILRQRYAKGEIDHDQFAQMQRDISP